MIHNFAKQQNKYHGDFMRIFFVTFWLSSLIFIQAPFAQSSEPYYLFPINPGKQNYLAGTMGELRSSHFHAGLDIKTGGVSGKPVHAAADGYISRIKISTGGYGHALYMTHPNGTTTVYAHLSKFESDIASYVLDRQYQEETFQIQLFPSKNQFEFKKGDIIAYSGNTGSSSGPHLHFEIRDSGQRILDPLQFDFKEIEDHITPQLKNIAFVTLDGNARINETYGRYEFDVLKVNNQYQTRVPIKLKGKIGIEVYAYDLLDGVYNRNGISKTTLIIDEDTIFSELKDKLSFSKQKNIMVHMDYQRYRQGGPKYNKLWVDDGNKHDFYVIGGEGFNFDDSIHQITIHMEDSYGNISTFKTTVNNKKVLYKPEPKMNDFDIYRNHLHIKSKHAGTPPLITLFFSGKKKQITPYRTDRKVAYYLWDLRKGLPDSLDINGEMKDTYLYSLIPSGREVSFYNHDFDIHLKKNSLFDTLYFQFKKEIDTVNNLEVFKFLNWDEPIKRSVEIKLKPTNNYVDSVFQVYGTYKGKIGSYQGGNWENDEISFNTSSLGTFTIAADTIGPDITPSRVTGQTLSFKIDDDRSGINSYKATLNGQFLLMYYEPKQKLIWAVRKDSNIPYEGEFLLEVEDNTGNITIYKKHL